MIVLGTCWEQNNPHPQNISSRHGGYVPCDNWTPISEEDLIQHVIRLGRENAEIERTIQEEVDRRVKEAVDRDREIFRIMYQCESCYGALCAWNTIQAEKDV